MLLFFLLLLIVAVCVGLGFAFKVLFIVAAVFFVLAVISYFTDYNKRRRR